MPHINASSDDRTNAIKLADRIATLLKSGINLSTSVVEYIDSTMAPASIDELTAILENRASSEAESLLDLLFFPDMGFQVQLEPLLERYPVNQTGCACLLDQLNRRNLATRFVFPDAGGQMVLPKRAGAR